MIMIPHYNTNQVGRVGYFLSEEYKNNEILQKIVSPLLDWYDIAARSMPWRDDPKPYHTWISEIMLQQTRVEAVRSYYTRFLSALPTIADLAAAPEQQLLKLWEGLGYYNRVRNLQKAAKIVMEKYHGMLPSDPAELEKLPGIGSYTAGAIASIAFGVAVPAVDGNVLRVISRIVGSYENTSRPETKKKMEEEIQMILPQKRPGDFNQALMDLGATVCIPNGFPLCGDCPLKDLCVACEKGTQMELPVKDGKKERLTEKKSVFLLHHQGKYALHKRPDRGLLAALWELPNVTGHYKKEELTELLCSFGIKADSISSAGTHNHIFTHLEWKMKGYWVEVASVLEETDLVWLTPEEIEASYPLPAAFYHFFQKAVE